MVDLSGVSIPVLTHMTRMVEAGSIKVVDGNYLFQTKEDPYGDDPKTLEQILEFVVWSMAYHVYVLKESRYGS